MIAGVGSLALILIGMFLWEAPWKGKAIILALVVLSGTLHLLGDVETAPIFEAFGFALRVSIAVVYLIWRRLPVVS